MTNEYGAPDQITPRTLGDYLEVMSRAAFQSGMSWKIVEAKWAGTREAFHNFEIDAVAEMNADDIDALTQDTRVIRNRRKLEAVVANAQRLINLERQHGSIKIYLGTLGNDFDAKVKRLRKDFKFLGDFGSYYLLYVVGEEVPPYREYRSARGK